MTKLYENYDMYVSYAFPLESGDTVRIFMPLSVTKKDIKRLIKFIEALQIDQ